MKGVVVQDAALLESGAAIRTAEGGAEHVQPITGDNIVNVLDDFRQAGYTVVTTSSEQGKPLFKTSLPAKMVLVLGQEYEGLPDAARDPNDLRVKIDGTGNVAGLNISVATGVCLVNGGVRIKPDKSAGWQLCHPAFSRKFTHSLPVILASSQWRLAMLFQPLICQHKMVAAKESTMRRKRRRMRCFQYMTALLIYNRPFLLRMRSPQQKHHAFAMLVNQADHFIGEGFPSRGWRGNAPDLRVPSTQY